MKKLLFVVTTFLVGCASTGVKTTTTENEKPLPKPEIKASYTRKVASVALTEKAVVLCPTKYDTKEETKLVEYANACVQQTKWSQVESLANTLAESNVQSPWGAYYLSLVAESKRDYPRAKWMIELAIKKAPQIGMLYFQRARLEWGLKEYHSSEESLQSSIEKDPQLIDAHVFLGQIYFRNQDYKKAAFHFNTVLQLRPNDPVALMGMSECLIHKKDFHGAVENLKKASKYYPSDVAFLLREAFLLESQLQEAQEALLLYRKIRSDYKQGKLKGELTMNLDQKIAELEKNSVRLAGSEKAK